MGACLSIGKNAENPFQSEVNHENSSGELNSGISPILGLPNPGADNEILETSNLKNFPFAVLQAATKNFHQDCMVSDDDLGRIFKGWIKEQSVDASTPKSGMIIAVKQFRSREEFLFSDFKKGVKHLARLDHPNFVKLVGYCLNVNHQLLAFEFMAHGSLGDHLFKRNSAFQPLSWNNRMKIALDAANGLAFLHSGEVNIIFRDFKSSRILLDATYNAKLYELGLARNGPTGEENHVSTRVMGTIGYIAPEYIVTGRLTTKCDVYAFGAVLLEMLTCRRIHDLSHSARETSLVDWAMPFMRNKEKLITLIDVEIEGQYSISGAQNAFSLAMQCLSTCPNRRPSMLQVVAALEQLQSEINPLVQG